MYLRPQENAWSYQLREMRHNPCLMSPISALLVFILALFWLLTMIIKFPVFLLGFFLQPLANRFFWVVEFLYPTAAGRSIHFFMLRMAQRVRKSSPTDKNYGYHSRAVECRIEVVKGRVFVHPLPQLMDNLGYLVVCCPDETESEPQVVRPPGMGKISISNKADFRIVAFVVDCGDAQAVRRQVKLISKVHYNKKKIYIQSILSTHKHHDHTAGNKKLMQDDEVGRTIKLVFGGAVEKVPQCNFLLSNGDRIPLPKIGNNDMGDLVEVEAIATPAHTRGSLTYALRPLSSDTSSVSTIFFSGDTMFSGGGGVPFESDLDPNQEENFGKMTANSNIRASAGMHAVERCFAELLFRSVPLSAMKEATSDRILIMPGHEYSADLLNRQFAQPTESCRWKNFSPSFFFETASHFYVSMHRRSLPLSNGKLLVAPTPLSRELLINPNLRSLKRRGGVVISAIRLWHHHFARERVSDSVRGAFGQSGLTGLAKTPVKSKSLESRWTLDSKDLGAPVFTTVYAADLDKVIEDLDCGKTNPRQAAQRLRELKSMLDTPLVGRRPIPDTLPSDHVVYKGLVGFALLGSAPTAVSLSDSKAMKMPPPVVTSSDLIRVSKKRLIAVLYWLGLLTEEDEGKQTVAIIDQLWKEAQEYEAKLFSFSKGTNFQKENGRYDTVDVESTSGSGDDGDVVDLGTLKWIVYGVSSQKPSCFSAFCMPCAEPVKTQPVEKHPINSSGMQREHGEYVRHNVFTCLLCKGAAGCPQADPEMEEIAAGADDRPVLMSRTDEDEIELSPHGLSAILKDL